MHIDKTDRQLSASVRFINIAVLLYIDWDREEIVPASNAVILSIVFRNTFHSETYYSSEYALFISSKQYVLKYSVWADSSIALNCV